MRVATAVAATVTPIISPTIHLIKLVSKLAKSSLVAKCSCLSYQAREALFVGHRVSPDRACRQIYCSIVAAPIWTNQPRHSRRPRPAPDPSASRTDIAIRRSRLSASSSILISSPGYSAAGRGRPHPNPLPGGEGMDFCFRGNDGPGSGVGAALTLTLSRGEGIDSCLRRNDGPRLRRWRRRW